MAEIDLGRGFVAVVDDDDLSLVSGYRWYVCQPDKSLAGTYAMAKPYLADEKRQPTVWLHRLITNCPKGMQVDHIDRNGLNNRRANLRICTQSQNNANAVMRVGVTGYRGVHPAKRRFLAAIYSGGKTVRVGLFDTPEDAARARDEAAIAMYGEFATLNFPLAA